MDRTASPMPKSRSKSRSKNPPKRVLALPDLEQTKAAVLNSLSSASGQRTYDHVITEFVACYCSEARRGDGSSVPVATFQDGSDQPRYRGDPAGCYAGRPSQSLTRACLLDSACRGTKLCAFFEQAALAVCCQPRKVVRDMPVGLLVVGQTTTHE